MSTGQEAESAEDAASRWREGVLEDAGASSAFASVFNLDTKVHESRASAVATARQNWTPAASQVQSHMPTYGHWDACLLCCTGLPHSVPPQIDHPGR